MRPSRACGMMILAGCASVSVTNEELEDAMCKEVCALVVDCGAYETEQECRGECNAAHRRAHDASESCATASAAVNACVAGLDCDAYAAFVAGEPADDYPCRSEWDAQDVECPGQLDVGAWR